MGWQQPLGAEADAPKWGNRGALALAISGARDFLKFYRALRLTFTPALPPN